MIDVDRLATATCPQQMYEALRTGGTFRDERGRWIVPGAADVEAVLHRDDTHVAAPATGIDVLAALVRAMARFTEDGPHDAGRAVAVDALRAVDLEALRRECDRLTAAAIDVAEGVDVTALARRVTVQALATALGFDDPQTTEQDVRAMAGALAPRRDAAPATDADVTSAIERLRRAAPADDEVVVANLVALLFQSVDATAGLVTNALLAAAAGDETSAARVVLNAARNDPPVHITRRLATERFDLAGHTVETGAELVLLLGDAGHQASLLTFGAGRHGCPGQQHALAIAAGIVGAVRASGRRLDLAAVRYEARTNLRIVDALTLAPPDDRVVG